MWLVWLLNRVWHLNCYRYTVCFVFEINLWCPHLTGDTRCYFYLHQKATRTNLEERQPHGSHHPTHTHLRYANEKERWVETHLSANYTPSPTPIPTPSEIFNPWKTGYFVQKAGFCITVPARTNNRGPGSGTKFHLFNKSDVKRRNTLRCIDQHTDPNRKYMWGESPICRNWSECPSNAGACLL